MVEFTRRESLALGLAAASIPILGAGSARAAVDDVPTANVKPPEYKLEKGATLSVLRPAKFVDADEKYWNINTAAFTKATGIEVKTNFLSWEDMRPQEAVTANTGAGPDIIVGWGADPQIYASKVHDMSDLADYLGKKYGGWYNLAKLYGSKWGTNDWLAIPMGGSTGPAAYRKSWVKEAGYDSIPDDLEGFLELCRKLQKNGHPAGVALGHAVGDANGYANWLLWSHGAYLVDEKGKIAIDSKETIAALKYAAELQKTFIPGTLAWNDSGNNKAYAAGQIGLTFNGVSIYFANHFSSSKEQQAIADDTFCQRSPKGLASAAPQAALVLSAMVFKHTKFPNAAKDYIRFMMEKDQYGQWLSNCLGYWSEPLASYTKMKFWDENPRIKAYQAGMDTTFYEGYRGPITPASSAVSANYTVVDMFASVASGASSPEAAAKLAARQAARYYK
jgi:multiple sugar transport system substrate-binding protein